MIQKTNCYMTFADENYLPCIVRQAQRIKYLQCKYPFIVLIDDNDKKSQQILEENNITYIHTSTNFFEKSNKYNFRFQKTINKFKLLDFLSEYEKICWLDADTILLKNIDYLFDEMSPNSQFLGFINPIINKIEGVIFILTNKINIEDFNSFLIKQLFQNDEEILNNYFLTEEFVNLSFTNYSNYLYHFSGYLKLYNYPDLFNIINKIFFEFSENEFNLFVDKFLFNSLLDESWTIFINYLERFEEDE